MPPERRIGACWLKRRSCACTSSLACKPTAAAGERAAERERRRQRQRQRQRQEPRRLVARLASAVSLPACPRGRRQFVGRQLFLLEMNSFATRRRPVRSQTRLSPVLARPAVGLTDANKGSAPQAGRPTRRAGLPSPSRRGLAGIGRLAMENKRQPTRYVFIECSHRERNTCARGILIGSANEPVRQRKQAGRQAGKLAPAWEGCN